MKTCRHCQSEIKKRNEFCDNVCMNSYYRKIKIRAFYNDAYVGEVLPKLIRKYLIKKSNNRCSKCSWSITNKTTGLVPLHIDHIDGNWRNNTSNNLRVLCPNCHSLTSNYGVLNRGNGRPKK